MQKILLAILVFVLISGNHIVFSQSKPMTIGLEFGAGGGWSVDGYGPSITGSLGNNELGIGFHWKNRNVLGGNLFYRRFFIQPSSRFRPYLEASLGMNAEEEKIFIDQWYGARIYGGYGALGIRYKIVKGLSIFGTFGIGKSYLFGRDPLQTQYARVSEYSSFGIRYEFKSSSSSTTNSDQTQPPRNSMLAVDARFRYIPFGHGTTPSGRLASLILGFGVRASNVIYPSIYLQLGPHIGPDGVNSGSFAFQGIGLGIRCELLHRGRWKLQSEAAYMRILRPTFYFSDSRLWIGHGLSYQLNDRLSIFASIGMTYNKSGFPLDCMSGLRWGLGRIKSKPEGN